MISNKFSGIAGAVMLGTAVLLGSSAAKAVKIDMAKDSFSATATYAKETLLDTAAGALSIGDAKYYSLGAAHELIAPLGVTLGAGDQTAELAVNFTLAGGVYMATEPSLDLCDDMMCTTNHGRGTLTVGGIGSAIAGFTVEKVPSDAKYAKLKAATLGVTSDGVLSATMNATSDVCTSQRLSADLCMNSDTNSSLVELKPALAETATGVDVTATAASGFTMFGDESSASLGKLAVGVAADLFDASDAMPYSLVLALANIEPGSADVTKASITFTGDFSFASKVTYSSDPSCADGDDLRMMDADDNVMDTTKPVAVGTGGHLCITVDSDAEGLDIPDAGPYMATTSYTGIPDAAFPPEGAPHMLGSISRDGTTVRLPFLTTNAKYKQRIRIVNRGPAALYSMAFHGMDDVGLVAEDAMLDANSITILIVNDVVTPGNGSSTSGTLTAEANSSMIDVATTQTHVERGTSDTVVYSVK